MTAYAKSKLQQPIAAATAQFGVAFVGLVGPLYQVLKHGAKCNAKQSTYTYY